MPSVSAPNRVGALNHPEPVSESPQRAHRGLVWSLVVLGSIVLVLSLTANWVQRELLNTDEVKSTTDQMLSDEDVQKALSTYAVDQLYANVDVQSAIEGRLPSSAQSLAVPVTAATKQLAPEVAQRVLESPRGQQLVVNAVGAAQKQFVDLVEDEDQFVSTSGGDVTFQYGDVIASVAEGLGVDPATIEQVQGLVQQYTTDLENGLTTAEGKVSSARSSLKQLEQGKLSSEQRSNLEQVASTAGEVHSKVGAVEAKLKGAQGSVPDQLQGAVSKLSAALSELDARAVTVEKQANAVLADPNTSNVQRLDAALGQLQGRINAALERPILQSPGQLTLISSSQLDGVQSVVSVLRSLGYILPVLALVLFVLAIYLARGWRREALIAAGGGILVATLVVLLARRLIGTQVVDSLASSETVQPAVRSVWEIISDGLRERALFVLVIGLAFIVGGILAGPGRHATAARRWLAPHLRDNPVAVYATVAVLFLLWLAFIPGIDNLGQVLVIVLLAVLAVVGVETLRRQTAREFPTPTTSKPSAASPPSGGPRT